MRICVFSGTTEGHELSRFLAANGVPAEVFVATEYGAGGHGADARHHGA